MKKIKKNDLKNEIKIKKIKEKLKLKTAKALIFKVSKKTNKNFIFFRKLNLN